MYLHFSCSMRTSPSQRLQELADRGIELPARHQQQRSGRQTGAQLLEINKEAKVFLYAAS